MYADYYATRITDVVLISPRVFSDSRGYFLESFRRDNFVREVEPIDFIQDNESMSRYGVLRGLHYQLPPHAQSKLVRVVTGEVLDVAVDIRRNSPTFGQYVNTRLSGENKLQLYIPKGFAHGFVVLSKKAVLTYKVDAPYAPDYEAIINYADPLLNIDWKIPHSHIQTSERDRKAPYLKDAVVFES